MKNTCAPSSGGFRTYCILPSKGRWSERRGRKIKAQKWLRWCECCGFVCFIHWCVVANQQVSSAFLFIFIFFYNFIASHASHTCLTCHGVSWKPLENFWKCPLHRGRPARFLCFSRSSFFLFSIPDMSSSFEEPSSGAPISASHLWRACEWASKELSPRVRPLMSCHLPI